MRLFDSHLHLTDDAFADDRAEVLRRARRAGVEGFVSIASDPEDAEAALALARSEPDVWCTAGLHPHAADAHGTGTLARIRALAAQPEVVAIGETGLDFHYENAPRDRQAEAFEAQLSLAAELALPVVVHSRDADAETAGQVRAWGDRLRGVLHCFTGGRTLLETAIEAGWYVSLSGIATFRSFDAAPVLAAVPADRLLIETDSPYLAPVPVRGRRNEPAHLVHTCRRLAAEAGEAPEALAARTAANAAAFYGLEAAAT